MQTGSISVSTGLSVNSVHRKEITAEDQPGEKQDSSEQVREVPGHDDHSRNPCDLPAIDATGNGQSEGTDPERHPSAVVYSNKKRWALSHTKVLERAFPNCWFINVLGQRIRLNDNLRH